MDERERQVWDIQWRLEHRHTLTADTVTVYQLLQDIDTLLTAYGEVRAALNQCQAAWSKAALQHHDAISAAMPAGEHGKE